MSNSDSFTSSRPSYSTSSIQEEESLWSGSPSQWLAADSWLLGSLLSAFAFSFGALALGEIAQEFNRTIPGYVLVLGILPMLIPVWKYLTLKFTTYEITSQRLFRKFGVLSTQTDEIELHRIRDFSVSEPLYLRIMGLGNIEIISVDKSIPSLMLMALPDPDGIRDIVRAAVSERQSQVGWREVEVT